MASTDSKEERHRVLAQIARHQAYAKALRRRSRRPTVVGPRLRAHPLAVSDRLVEQGLRRQARLVVAAKQQRLARRQVIGPQLQRDPKRLDRLVQTPGTHQNSTQIGVCLNVGWGIDDHLPRQRNQLVLVLILVVQRAELLVSAHPARRRASAR
ncbi:MAG: hypothetical protein IPO66_12670 [Rhodanobacteraceae bacterium]|nr:hypothetical protein [Rhodanobacteraceae bacterium]